MKKSELGNRVTLFVSRVPADVVFFQLPLPPPPPILRLVKRNGVTKLAERLPYIPPKALYSEKAALAASVGQSFLFWRYKLLLNSSENYAYFTKQR